MKTNPNASAFPRPATDTYACRGADGMDIRTFMATAFLVGLVTNPELAGLVGIGRTNLPQLAVGLADDLIKELNKGQPNEVPSED